MNNKITFLLALPLIVWAIWTLVAPSDSERESARKSWDVTVDENGQLSVLGVTIDKTSLKEAEKILNSQSEQALFISPKDSNKEPAIEAFFPKMPDGSKLILNLAASDEVMEKIINSASNPIAFPSGNVKFEISEEHLPIVQSLKVKSLTAIPRIKITPEMLTNQFGIPVQQIANGDIMHNLYPKIGLDAILDKSGEVMLQFVSPASFSNVLEALGVTSEIKTDTAP